VCQRCYQQAHRRIGTCHDCQLHRVLPGQHDGQLSCASCAGIDGFVCITCSAVDQQMSNLHTCIRCWLRRRVIAKISDGNEPAGAALTIVDMICARPPRGLAKWLRTRPDLVAELRAIAVGEHELTHDYLDLLGPSRRVQNLRQQLIETGLLSARHHQLALFDQWTTQLLTSIDNIGGVNAPDPRRT
jgi:hypothetical protein